MAKLFKVIMHRYIFPIKLLKTIKILRVRCKKIIVKNWETMSLFI